MALLTSAALALAAGAGIFAAIAAVVWTWDAGLPARTTARLSRELCRPGRADEAVLREAGEAFLRAAVGPQAPFGRFARRVAGASAGALAATTLVWFVATPGLP
ncbi:MAG: hypothetical protein ACU0DT_00070, partial [Albimonas sp.]|uniref:hypothetical protein n=1 Tax=Albimonas sp. TaxID=1872425 RepID=UPI004055C80E